MGERERARARARARNVLRLGLGDSVEEMGMEGGEVWGR
jgi:hypothetical protein